MRLGQPAAAAARQAPANVCFRGNSGHRLNVAKCLLGEKVTLFARGGSKTQAELVSVCPKPLRLSRPAIDSMSALAALLDSVARRADDFDVIHCHLDWVHIPLLRQLEAAVCPHAAWTA